MDWLWQLALLSLRTPRRAMRRILAMDLTSAHALSALALSSVLSAIVTVLAGLLLGTGAFPMFGSPLNAALSHFVLYAFISVLIWGLSRLFGGSGGMTQTMLAVAWLETVMIGVQLAMVLLMLVLPWLSLFLMIGTLALFFWMLSQFVAEVHGFRSALAVFGVTLAAIAVLSVLLSPLFVDLIPGAGVPS